MFGDPKVFDVGSFPVTETMLTSLSVTVFLIVAAVVLKYAVVRRPGSAHGGFGKAHRGLARPIRCRNRGSPSRPSRR